MDELAFLTATEQADLVRRGEVTSGELVELYLGRIERLDPELNAFVTVCSEFDEPRDGPFRGVPLPIKDLNETAGILTTFSSRAFADYVPDFDVAVVRRLKDAGFVVLGKTNTPELGITAVTESELNGACRNPWDTSRTPGGSSGGAAVGGRGRDVAGRARERRRRLDPHSGVVLRAVRDQARPGPRLAGAVGRARGLLDQRPADPHGARRCCASRRDGRLRDRRSVVGPAARAPLRRGGRPRPGQAARRPDVLAADRRAGRSGVRDRRRGDRRAPRRSSATTSRKRPRRGAPTSCSGSSCRSGRSARR